MDNTQINLGVGGDIIATDAIGGVKHQRVKVEFGVDGSATDVSAANPLPVGLSSLPLPAGHEESVRFVRIVRDDKKNRFHELRPEEVSATWADPVLRYSNILQGLFHGRVVVCEADADCRFFGAVLDQLADDTDRSKEVDDVLFVPTGGKHGVPALAGALGGLGVETHALLDFDVLRCKKDIKAIVVSMGHDWEEFNADYDSFFSPRRNEKQVDLSKKIGLNAVPAGAPTIACQRLMESLDGIGVHVIPVGEMEGFDRTFAQKSSEWATHALLTNVHKTSQRAKDYVGRVLENPPTLTDRVMPVQ